MRQYKFKGKRVDNGEWVYGKVFFLDNPKYYSILPIGSDVYPEISADGETGRYLIEPIEVIPETIGQFTGLHDESGVEIYEGDLFICPEHHKPKKYEVTWSDDNERACFYCFNGDGTGFSPNEIEVIGNIHDKE